MEKVYILATSPKLEMSLKNILRGKIIKSTPETVLL